MNVNLLHGSTENGAAVTKRNYKLQERMGFRLSRLSKMMQTRLETLLREQDLTRLEWCVLSGVGLEHHDSPSGLAEHIGITRPAVSRLLKALTSRGLIERALTNNDGRSRKLSLTVEGRTKLGTCLPIVEQNQHYFASKLNTKQQAALDEALDAIMMGEAVTFEDL